MHRILITSLAAILLTSCVSNGSSGDEDNGGENAIDSQAEGDVLEEQAYENTGDVRVYYYVKEAVLEGARDSSTRQDEMRHVLVNKGHSFYRGVPDHKMPVEERFLYNSDMYDLLKILKELDFFERGNSVNILGDDPVQRADREPNTTRMIAVEIIKDGKVNTSYFARRAGENTLTESEDAYERSTAFNQCQAVVMQAVAGSLPRGTAAQGSGDTEGLGHD